MVHAETGVCAVRSQGLRVMSARSVLVSAVHRREGQAAQKVPCQGATARLRHGRVCGPRGSRLAGFALGLVRDLRGQGRRVSQSSGDLGPGGNEGVSPPRSGPRRQTDCRNQVGFRAYPKASDRLKGKKGPRLMCPFRAGRAPLLWG